MTLHRPDIDQLSSFYRSTTIDETGGDRTTCNMGGRGLAVSFPPRPGLKLTQPDAGNVVIRAIATDRGLVRFIRRPN